MIAAASSRLVPTEASAPALLQQTGLGAGGAALQLLDAGVEHGAGDVDVDPAEGVADVPAGELLLLDLAHQLA